MAAGSDSNQKNNGTTLREKALGGNPSQLGDPISLKNEMSDKDLKPEQNTRKSQQTNTRNTPSQESGSGSGRGGKEKLREKASKALHGPDANPSMLGDPISMKNETTDNLPRSVEDKAMSQTRSKL
jgi:hypothetical protein